jgi:hypothetical protein
MNSLTQRTIQRPTTSVVGVSLALTGLLLAACGGPTGPGLLTEREGRATRPAAVAIPGADPDLRHNGRRAQEQQAGPPSVDMLASLFDYDLPPGWLALEPVSSRFSTRFINLQPAGDARAECYLSVLASDGGGLGANVNRWRSQMGLEPLGTEALAKLPRRNLLSGEGVYLDLRGSFAGMGQGAGQEDWGLLGLIVPIPGQTLFAKMTGPADLIEAETDAFEAFCESLRPSATGMKMARDEGDHEGHDHGEGEGHDHEASTQDQSPAQTETAAAGGLAWQPLEGWVDQGQRTMRLVSYQLGSTTECYLALARGDQLTNFNRWRGQVGLESMSQADLDQLETVTVLGEACPLLEITGDYRSMGGETKTKHTLLGVMRPMAGDSLFVKMIGPADEVAAARDEFLQFCASIRQAN